MLYYILNVPSISHFTYHLRYYIIIDHDLTSYNKLCYVYFISNEPIKVADLQNSANQLILNDTLVIDLSVKARKLWSFDKARNVLIKTKIEILIAVENTRFH